jgi:Zn-dependent protease/CBS domain-containing protein
MNAQAGQSQRAATKRPTTLAGSFRLGRIAGIEIGIHYTWILAFVLMSWSLAAGFFPQEYPEWSTGTYWITAIMAALLLFVCVLAHELAHSLVAQARGMPVRGITLFIFGGVSNVSAEAERPRDEFAMTVVGPLTSLVLAGVFWGLRHMVGEAETPLSAMLGYLAFVNALLAAFNLLPGFPLDGGRILRSVLWQSTGNLVRATNIAASVGHVFAWLLIGWGFLSILGGNLLGGVWTGFIGWFLNGAAEASRSHVTLRQHLRGMSVRDVMDPNPASIAPQTPVEQVVRDAFLHGGRRAVLVVRDNELLGIVTLTDVRELPHEEWAVTPVERVMTRPPLHTVVPDQDLGSALTLLAEHGLNQVPVLEDGRLTGLLSRADIIRYLRMSQELGIRPQR